MGGDGDIEVSEDGSDDRRLMDSDTVDVTIYLTYELGGEEKTKAFTFDKCPINKMAAPTLTGNVYSSTQSGRTLVMNDYRIKLNKPTGDPHSYNLRFDEIRIYWYTEGGEIFADEKVIWTDGDGNYPFSVDGPYIYSSDEIDIMPPVPDCTHYSLWFHAIAEGDDEFDTNYPGINLTHESEKWELPDIY